MGVPLIQRQRSRPLSRLATVVTDLYLRAHISFSLSDTETPFWDEYIGDFNVPARVLGTQPFWLLRHGISTLPRSKALLV
jgi:hypothetical protein